VGRLRRRSGFSYLDGCADWDEIRIDLTDANEFGHEDTQAIEVALEEYLADEEVKVIPGGWPRPDGGGTA
jgi:hypothetical protein